MEIIFTKPEPTSMSGLIVGPHLAYAVHFIKWIIFVKDNKEKDDIYRTVQG